MYNEEFGLKVKYTCPRSLSITFSGLQTPRQKSLKNEKSLPKDDSKLQTPAKKVIANGPGEDSVKAARQSRVSKKLQASETSNSLSNLVKVETTKRKWTDGSVSWQSLPPSLAKLGKVR